MTNIFLIDLGHAPSESRLAPFLIAEDWHVAKSFKSPLLEKRYLYSRAVLRQQLALFSHRPLAELHIKHDAYNKPYLTDGPYFSISHSYPFCAIAIANHPIGIDIEYTSQPIDPVLFEVCLSEKEKANWECHSDFYMYWCAKEAVLKAYGTGLLYDPRQLSLSAYDNDLLVTQIANQRYYIKYRYVAQSLLVAVAQPTPFSLSIPHNWCALHSFF